MLKINWNYVIIFIFVLLFVSVFLIFNSEYKDSQNIREFIQSTGPLAPITLILFQLVQTIIPFVPGGIITIAGGYVFGVVLGTVYSLIGLVFGAVIVFFISNKYLKSYVDKKIKKKRYIKKIYKVIDAYGVYFLFFSRMMPFFPHDLISYAIGTSNISRKKFIIATVLGFLPHSFLHNYIGDSFYQSSFGFGFYLVIFVFILSGFVYLFQEKIIDKLIEIKKNYKLKK